jgi:hypothetical protein
MLTITDKSEGDDSPDNLKPYQTDSVDDAWEFIQNFALSSIPMVIQDGDAPCSFPLTKQRLKEQIESRGSASIFYGSLADDPILEVVSN